MCFKKIIIYFVVILSIVKITSTKNNLLSRHKRFLVFPLASPTRLQFIVGVGLPVIYPANAITVGYVFKAQYYLPDNASQLRPNVDYSRRKRETPPQYTRWSIYKILEALISSHGMDGRACVLRAICEAAENPFTYRNGILGELAHVILSPSTTNEELDHHYDNQYLAAEEIGKESQDALEVENRCVAVFRECKSSLLEMFTNVQYLYKKMLKK